MIKGTRVEAINSTQDIGSGATGYNMIAVPTNKTFVLTDLIVTGSYAADACTSASNAPLKLWDYLGSGGTDASGGTSAVCRLSVLLTPYSPGAATAVMTSIRGTRILHLTNGPEFTLGFTPQMSGPVIGTGCLWISGVLR